MFDTLLEQAAIGVGLSGVIDHPYERALAD